MLIEKKGQVWIETVLYTLIGISLIGLILGFTMPKINEAKDRALVEQTINSLNQFDEKINSVLQAPGNVRIIEFGMKRGQFQINTTGNNLVFLVEDLTKPYSEPGVQIEQGRIKIISEEGSKKSRVVLNVNYNLDLKYNGLDSDTNTQFNAAPTPYRFSVESVSDSSGNTFVNIKEISGR